MNREELLQITEGYLENPLHFSIGVLWKREITGYTIEIEPAVSGPIHEDTGMIMDFRKVKDAVNSVLIELDHKMLIVPQHRITQTFWERGIEYQEIPDDTLPSIGKFLFEKIHWAIKGEEWEFLRHLQVKFSPSDIYTIRWGRSKKETAKETDTSQIHLAVNFVHRLEKDTGKCHNPHGHTWEIYIQLSYPIKQAKYQQVKADIQKALRAHWHNRAVLHEKDELKKLFLDHGIITQWLPIMPTTENIAWEMFIQIQNLLDRSHNGIRIEWVKLQETPSNKYVLIRKN